MTATPFAGGGRHGGGDRRVLRVQRPGEAGVLRRLAEKRGLILLTDPDGAGFVIRNHLKGPFPASS